MYFITIYVSYDRIQVNFYYTEDVDEIKDPGKKGSLYKVGDPR